MKIIGLHIIFEEPTLRARYPDARITHPLTLRQILQVLVDWRRYDLAQQIMDELPKWYNHKPKTMKTFRDIVSAPDDVHTIGKRKGNVENMGSYINAPQPQALTASLYFPSAKSFLRGKLGHTYTGILAMTDAFADGTDGTPRDREMIFLVPNDPPTPEEQRASSITEPYVNRPFSRTEMGNEIGYRRWSASDAGMDKNLDPVVHGRGGNTSHEQLRTMIVKSNRYSGDIIDDEDPAEGEGKFIGFTVMKGGFRPGTTTMLPNIYGWTSNSMNRKVFRNPSPAYKVRRTEGLVPGSTQFIKVLGRLKAQVDVVWAEKIRHALDGLLELQLEDARHRQNTNGRPDPHFVNVLRRLEL